MQSSVSTSGKKRNINTCTAGSGGGTSRQTRWQLTHSKNKKEPHLEEGKEDGLLKTIIGEMVLAAIVDQGEKRQTDIMGTKRGDNGR